MFLGDFLEQLAVLLQSQTVAMPFEDEGPWHELFYDLKKATWEGKPAFLGTLRFDWDGPYPKCQELSEFLHTLHWNACVDARNPHFDVITIPPGIARVWSQQAEQLDAPTKAFLANAAAHANQLFNQTATAT